MWEGYITAHATKFRHMSDARLEAGWVQCVGHARARLEIAAVLAAVRTPLIFLEMFLFEDLAVVLGRVGVVVVVVKPGGGGGKAYRERRVRVLGRHASPDEDEALHLPLSRDRALALSE